MRATRRIPNLATAKPGTAGHGSPLLVDQVEHALRERVAHMLATSEVALPQEQDLARSFGVSMKTLRSAMRRLKDDRLVRAVTGKGTFVISQEQRTAPVVVLCTNLKHPYNALCAETVASALRARRQAASLCTCEEIDHDWPLFCAAVQDARGILVAGYLSKANLDGLLARTTKPVVQIGDVAHTSIREPLGCRNVVIDMRAAFFLATRHLLNLGHRRILLAGWFQGTSWGRDFVRGYREALEGAGVPYDERLIVHLPTVSRWDGGHPSAFTEPRSGMQAEIDRLLDGGDAPTALLHNATSELLIGELLARHFRNRLAADHVMAVTYTEYLESGFLKPCDGLAVGVSMKGLTARAIDLLNDDGAAAPRPTCEILDLSALYRRSNGRWRQMAEAAGAAHG